MTFDEAYSKLEDKFKAMVEEDRKSHGIESFFLPNVRPKCPVDFVLVGMEPSLGGMDFETAKQKAAAGKFTNWGAYPEESTLEYAVYNYLRASDESFYFTDLAHGAMKPQSEGANDTAKYERWYPLFEEELGLVTKLNAKIIAVGHTTRDFLTRKGLYGYAGMVGHPANTGLGSAGKETKAYPKRWETFLQRDPNEFPSKVNKTEAQEKRLFGYMIQFERIRNPELVGWLAHRRAWQHLLSGAQAVIAIYAH